MHCLGIELPQASFKADLGKPTTTSEQLADDRPPWFKHLEKLHSSTLKHWENQIWCMQKENNRYYKYLRTCEKILEKQIDELIDNNSDLYVQLYPFSLLITVSIQKNRLHLSWSGTKGKHGTKSLKCMRQLVYHIAPYLELLLLIISTIENC